MSCSYFKCLCIADDDDATSPSTVSTFLHYEYSQLRYAGEFFTESEQ